MLVADKLRHLRLVEGHLRGLNRELAQKEVVSAIRAELGRTISQPYLSQLESGQRKHLTNTTRLLLAQFFKVHPGYLVDDPDGFRTELLSNLQSREEKLDLWLVEGVERFRRDPELAEALLTICRHTDTRKCLVLLAEALAHPELIERLSDLLLPAKGAELHDHP